jgi:hypothetical protein
MRFVHNTLAHRHLRPWKESNTSKTLPSSRYPTLGCAEMGMKSGFTLRHSAGNLSTLVPDSRCFPRLFPKPAEGLRMTVTRYSGELRRRTIEGVTVRGCRSMIIRQPESKDT